MKFMNVVTLGLAAGIALAQEPPAAPILAWAPKVELSGTIESVQVLRGQGTPYVLVKSGTSTMRVILGSMRYLLERGFNPKAGEAIQVKGFRMNNDVYAASVTLPGQGKTLQLRDESGRPLWIGGYGRGGRGRGWTRGGP